MLICRFLSGFLEVPLNYFTADNVRNEESKPVMLMTFGAKRDITFYTMDMLSFLVSEANLRFVEYFCVGELK